MFTQAIPFEAADPPQEVALDAVAEEFVSDEYVYLFLIVDCTVVIPSWNIPREQLPVAVP